MGKSPGKWIKTILFGKKASRSNLSKGRDGLKSANEKDALVSAKVPTAGLDVSPPLISHPEPVLTYKNGGNSEMEHVATSNFPRDGMVLVPGDQDADEQGTTRSDASNGPERIRLEQAATKAQAAFRGYLARRAFRALMGIIRLQALIRGHLVRRQAVATLRCVHGIVKFQALVRGQRVDAKLSNSFRLNTFTRVDKLLANAFISKLLASLPNATPLRLKYAPGESNSAWNWLERWTISRVWEPLPQPKKVSDSKSQTRPKRSVRRVPAANIDNGSIRSTSASDKPKRNFRKVQGHPVDPVQESSQNELEKVKRNLRKVSNATNETADQVQVEAEKPKRIPRKGSGSPAPDLTDHVMVGSAETEKLKHIPMKVSGSTSETAELEVEIEKLKSIPRNASGSADYDVPDQGMVESAEKMKKDTSVPVTKHPEGGATQKSLAADQTVDLLHDDHPAIDSSPLDTCGKDENTHVANGKLISKDDQGSNENHKASKRRSSFPTKQEYPETGSQNTPKLPSYMAATASAKAKLRGQGSPKSGSDGIEQNGITRRHSLPSTTNAKLSSLSPQTQRLQVNNKGMIKHDRSILSSKDGNEKVAQAEWRR